MSRKRTDSLTELGKEIAREIFEEKIKEHIIKYHTPETENNSYAIWSEAEDKKLLEEFNKIIQVLSTSHGRTPGAIISRIHKKFFV